MLSPAALVSRAANYGVSRLALTDHDTLDGLPEAHRAAQANNVELIDGIELSVRHGNREIHVLGLWLDTDNSPLRQLVASQQQARTERARQIGHRLDKAAGLANSYEKACQLANSQAPGRPFFAQVLQQAERVRNQRHAFNRFLKQGQSAFVATPWCDLPQAINTLHAAGGKAVLAHPQAYGLTRKRLRQLLGDFKDSGGDGLEVMMPRLSPQQKALLDECWQHFDLQVSAGSDFHSPAQTWLALGQLPPTPEGATAVWEQ